MLEKLEDFKKADHYWYVKIDHPVDAVQYKGQQGRLPWMLASSEGRTAGCWVSDKGKFYIYTRESDVGDEMGEGLPTDKPLWGFVAFRREWKVEANYKVAIPKGETAVWYELPLVFAWFLLVVVWVIFSIAIGHCCWKLHTFGLCRICM